MAAVEWRISKKAGTARVCEGLAGMAAGTEVHLRRPAKRNTLPSQRASNRASVIFSGDLCKSSQKMVITSRWAAICGRRTRSIRKKIIGHGMPTSRRRFARGSGLHLRRALALLHQPARQHGGGILLKPLVEKRGDLFPKISGMAEAREFIALQRGAGGREKELPGGLDLLAMHEVLLKFDMNIISL